jgi:hypothetical protein
MITGTMLLNAKSFSVECPPLRSWLSAFARLTFKFLCHFFSCVTVQKWTTNWCTAASTHTQRTPNYVHYTMWPLLKSTLKLLFSSLPYGRVLIWVFVQYSLCEVNPTRPPITLRAKARRTSAFPLTAQQPMVIYKIASEEGNGPTDNSLRKSFQFLSYSTQFTNKSVFNLITCSLNSRRVNYKVCTSITIKQNTYAKDKKFKLYHSDNSNNSVHAISQSFCSEKVFI